MKEHYSATQSHVTQSSNKCEHLISNPRQFGSKN